MGVLIPPKEKAAWNELEWEFGKWKAREGSSAMCGRTILTAGYP